MYFSILWNSAFSINNYNDNENHYVVNTSIEYILSPYQLSWLFIKTNNWHSLCQAFSWTITIPNVDITGILYTLKHISGLIIENLRPEISFAVHSVSISHYLQIKLAEILFSANHQGINIFWFPKIWRHCREDTTVRWQDEDITVSSFSLYLTWHNDLCLHNQMILVIILIMFIYSGIIIWDPWILFATF